MVLAEWSLSLATPGSVPYSAARPKETTMTARGKATPTSVAIADISNYYYAANSRLARQPHLVSSTEQP
jgi:hypothetical protein